MGKTFYEVSCFNGVGSFYSQWFDDRDKAYEFYWSNGVACRIRAHHYRSEKKIFDAERRVSDDQYIADFYERELREQEAYERQIAEDYQRSV